MPLKVELVGARNHWTFNQPRIRVGTDSSSDVSLKAEEFPSVARDHVVLRLEGHEVTFACTTPVGVQLNGQRVQQGRISTGDVLKLGPGGPELRFEWIEPVKSMRDQMRELQGKARAQQDVPTLSEVEPAAPPAAPPPRPAASMRMTEVAAGSAPTMLGKPDMAATMLGKPDLAATMVGKAPASALDTPTMIGRPPTPGAEAAERQRVAEAATAQVPVQRRAGGVGVGVGRAEAPEGEAPAAAAPEAEVTETGLSPEEEAMIEQKLNAVRNLLAANLIAVVLLLGVTFVQNQLIQQNKTAVLELKAEAHDAVGQLMPQLNARLNKFEQRVDAVQVQINGADGRMKQAEDHFVQRIDRELPAMMDKYLNRKMEEAKRQGVIPR